MAPKKSAPAKAAPKRKKRVISSPAPASLSSQLIVRGAREHNLRSVDLDLPRDQLIVFTEYPVRANLRWLSTRSTPRGNAVT